jgi:hypothetical protein
VTCDWFHEAARSCWRTAGVSTTTNFHGCRPNELGASTSACSSADQTSGASLRCGSKRLVA